jgi:hypothetical protein
MNSQDFLIMNAVGAGAFILWYLVSRGGSHKQPTKLKLDATDSAPVFLPEAGKTAEGGSLVKKRSYHPDMVMKPAPKNLNIMFNYNGHSWDAYEVLGVPAGANITMVTEAYHVAVRRCDKESVEFLETAYKAILQKQI